MDIPSWCRVGNKVVCVQGTDGAGFCAPIVEGEVYVIREVVVRSGGVGLYLEGIENPNPFWGETGYIIHRFRPLVSQQDDIETHFAHFLTSGKDARITEGV